MIAPADTKTFCAGWTKGAVICAVRRPVTVSGRVHFSAGGYMAVYHPAELDRLYLGLTAANLAGDAEAMRTIGAAIVAAEGAMS